MKKSFLLLTVLGIIFLAADCWLLYQKRQLKRMIIAMAVEKKSANYQLIDRERMMIAVSSQLQVPDSIVRNRGLYFMFSENTCPVCLETELTNLARRLDSVHFIFFAGKRYLLKNYPSLYHKLNVAILPNSNGWGVNMLELEVPVLFYSDGRSVRNVFIPNKTDKSFSLFYYQFMLSNNDKP